MKNVIFVLIAAALSVNVLAQSSMVYYTPTGSSTYSSLTSSGGCYTSSTAGCISSPMPCWYLNLEKYWYYRYRLVEDFTYIGPEVGENMIAYERIKGDIAPLGSVRANALDFEDDQTNDLGSYMAVLALEYRQLKDNGFSTDRTLWEITCAQNAFDRLRYFSTGYYAVMPFIMNDSLPIITSGLIAGDVTDGFFVRDDVPSWNFVSAGYPPSTKYNRHFNRPYLVNTMPDKVIVSSIGGDLANSYWGYNGATMSIIGSSGHRPPSESQDQMNQIYLGEQALIQYLDPSDPIAGPLKIRAENALFHTMKYLEHHETSPFLFWSIPDPVNTAHCVNNNCSQAGIFYPSSFPAMFGLHRFMPSSSPWYAPTGPGSGNLQGEVSNAMAYYAFQTLMQLDPLCCNYATQNIVYTDGFACYGPELGPVIPCPFPPLSGFFWMCPLIMPAVNYYVGYIPLGATTKKNLTWAAIKRHAWDFHFNAPHLPLIFELNWHDRGWVRHGDVENLLNSAPKCGPWNYEQSSANVTAMGGVDDWSNYTMQAYDLCSSTDWNCNNRLTDANHRQGLNCTDLYGNECHRHGNDMAYDADFNGLDYMWLFNLYAAERGMAFADGAAPAPYLGGMMNSYYCENFNVPYPSGGIGSFSNRLKLNWLEYLSAIDVINPGGWVDFRGAQKIDLKPSTTTSGFWAKPGSFFLAHIQDYNCSGGDIGDGPYNFAELNPTALRLAPGDSTASVDTGWREIVYLPNGAGYHFTPSALGEPAEDMDTTSNFNPNDWQSIIRTHKDEFIQYLNDVKQYKEYQDMLGVNLDSVNINDVIALLFPDTLIVDVYPNPTNSICNLSYTLSNQNSVSVTLTNTLGQDLSYLIDPYDRLSEPGQYKIGLNTNRLTPGLYYLYVTIGTKSISKKIAVLNH